MNSHVIEPDFERVIHGFMASLDRSTVFAVRPELRNALRILTIPERVLQFRVTWEDDENVVRINNGFRVQFNSALGPYKGGTRFDASVNLSVCKFLAWEQMCKNALIGLNLGGAKGGSDFNPKGKSDSEVRRFCVAYMQAMCRYIGADIDVPAGDIGVGRREVGWMFGAYKSRTSRWDGSITSKGEMCGGSLMKSESTGLGLIYFLQHMVAYVTSGKDTIQGKILALSGKGIVARHAALKAMSLGAVVMSLSDSKGAYIARTEEGLGTEDLVKITESTADLRPSSVNVCTNSVENYQFLPGEKSWKNVRKFDVALPCATQNEVSGADAEALIVAGCRYVVEGSNLGCSQAAVDLFEKQRYEGQHNAIWFGPGLYYPAMTRASRLFVSDWIAGKAANIGGSVVSGFEMAQNSQRSRWTADEVDRKLRIEVKSCFETIIKAAKTYVREDGLAKPNLILGSNIAAFIKLAEAMNDQGDCW